MTDYTTMSDDDLRRAIAEALGWRIDMRAYTTVEAGGLQLINAEGESVWFDLFDKDADLGTQLNAFWLRAFEIEFVPDWPRDLDAAVKLSELVPGTFILQSSAQTIWQAFFLVDGSPQSVADTPARAVCLAWLAWKGQGR